MRAQPELVRDGDRAFLDDWLIPGVASDDGLYEPELGNWVVDIELENGVTVHLLGASERNLEEAPGDVHLFVPPGHAVALRAAGGIAISEGLPADLDAIIEDSCDEPGDCACRGWSDRVSTAAQLKQLLRVLSSLPIVQLPDPDHPRLRMPTFGSL